MFGMCGTFYDFPEHVCVCEHMDVGVCICVSARIDAVHWAQARAHARMRDELYANEEFMQAVHHKHEQQLGLQY